MINRSLLGWKNRRILGKNYLFWESFLYLLILHHHPELDTTKNIISNTFTFTPLLTYHALIPHNPSNVRIRAFLLIFKIHAFNWIGYSLEINSCLMLNILKIWIYWWVEYWNKSISVKLDTTGISRLCTNNWKPEYLSIFHSFNHSEVLR